MSEPSDELANRQTFNKGSESCRDTKEVVRTGDGAEDPGRGGGKIMTVTCKEAMPLIDAAVGYAEKHSYLVSAAFRANSRNVELSTDAKPVFYAGVSLVRAGELAIGQGALPIWRDDEVIGALGVSGLAPERDEEVAVAALAACGYPTSPSEGAALAAQGLSAPQQDLSGQ